MTLDGNRIMVEMGPEELDFLEEFEKQLNIVFGSNENYLWGDILEAYVRARDKYFLPKGFVLKIP